MKKKAAAPKKAMPKKKATKKAAPMKQLYFSFGPG